MAAPTLPTPATTSSSSSVAAISTMGVVENAVLPPPSTSSVSILAWWKSFDFEAKRKWMDENSAEIANKQDASAGARRILGEELGLFKKLGTDEEKAEAVPGLLRLFQDEVDALTRRARFAEKSFLQLVKDVYEAPDPAPSLATGVESVRSLRRAQEETMKLTADIAEAKNMAKGSQEDAVRDVARLTRENAALEEELAKLNNQDITIRELEDRIEEFESTIETQVNARLALREAELRRIFDRDVEGIRETEMIAEGRVAALTTAVAEAHAARDEAQAALYGVRARVDDELASRQAETDAALSEAGRLREALATTTAQLDELKRRVAVASMYPEEEEEEERRRVEEGRKRVGGEDVFPSSSSSATSATPNNNTSNHESRLLPDMYASLKAQIDVYKARAEAAEDECGRAAISLTQAQEEGKRWGSVLDAQKRLHEESIADLRARLVARDADVASLRRELNERPSVNDVVTLRHQLALLQSMQFNALGDGSGNSSNDSSSSSSSNDNGNHTKNTNNNIVEDYDDDDDAVKKKKKDGDELSNNSHGSSTSASGGDMVDVSTLMLRRIRHLENKCVSIETAKKEADAMIVTLRTELEAAHESIQEYKLSISKLEDAISNENNNTNNRTRFLSSSSSYSNMMHPMASNSQGGRLGLGGDILSSSFSSSSNNSNNNNGGASSSSSSSTSSILTAQKQLDAIFSKPMGDLSASSVSSYDMLNTSFHTDAASSSSSSPTRRDSLVLEMTTLNGSSNNSSSSNSNLIGSPRAGGNGSGGMNGSSNNEERDATIARVLRSQRDRLRTRVAELEGEAAGRVGELTEAHSRIAKLTGDNVRMYEKIRFLQSYVQQQQQQQHSVGTSSGNNTDASALNMRARGGGANLSHPSSSTTNTPFSLTGEDDSEKAYKTMYQETLDPFETFARQQRAKQYNRLSPADRFTLRGGSLLAGNKVARLFFLGYALALHLLVAVTLWHFTQVSHAASSCGGSGEGGSGVGGGGIGMGGGNAHLPPGLEDRST